MQSDGGDPLRRLRCAGDRHKLRVNPVGPGRRTMAP
jgi:hypothetical protein